MRLMSSWSRMGAGRSATTIGPDRCVPDPAPEGRSTAAEQQAVLTRWTPDELAQARQRRDALLGTARMLVRAIDHDPDLADCAGAGCALAGWSDGDRCGLVHRLAGLDEGAVAWTHETTEEPIDPGSCSVTRANRAFEVALTDAVDAVRRCRQTQHGAGRCWFSSVPDVDGCGEILRAAHRLG